MRKYKIYEKDGYTYVHYDGFLEGVKIKKNERLYNYEWGWMTVTKDGKYYDFNDEEWDSVFDKYFATKYLILSPFLVYGNVPS